jgi:uncharacterized protein (TIGR03382 family)
MIVLGDAGVPAADGGHDASVGDGSVHYDAAPPHMGGHVVSGGCSAMPGRGAGGLVAMIASVLGAVFARRRRRV